MTWTASAGEFNAITEQLSGSLTTQGIGAGTAYSLGYYEAPAADANLNQAGPTVNLGTANISKAAHAFLVAGGAGAVDAGSCSIVVSGTSIDDDGTRTPADSETIVADITAMALDDYYETSKKWIGQITYTLTPAGAANYSADFNYGFAKYDDAFNRNFTVVGAEIVGLAGNNDAGFDFELLWHSSAGWSYNAAAFVPGGTVIIQLSTVHGAESDLASGEHFAFKRTGLSQAVNGSGSEGIVARITAGAVNAVEYANIHVEIELD